jgi:hypothetical protein
LMAAIATFALNAGVWLRRERLTMTCSSRGALSPRSG